MKINFRKILVSPWTALALILTLTGCAGIAFCDQDGKPKGCRKWDPATTSGAVSR